jgi:hypothetical protein
MYCKIIEEVFRESLGEIQLEKISGKTKWELGKVFKEPLGGAEISQGSVNCGKPLKSIRYLRGLFQYPQRVLKICFGRVCIKPLKYIKGLFEWDVRKGFLLKAEELPFEVRFGI